ncbi:MAG: hypothetical protein KIS61_19280 [Candidatus Eremiobacteraeota bacterium]|nr:hypothetical protein [Candidatus Eremiobacteraeota bacterium]
MRITLLIFLMLSSLAAGEPELFQSENRVLGHVLLVAEDGDAEASVWRESDTTAR